MAAARPLGPAPMMMEFIGCAWGAGADAASLNLQSELVEHAQARHAPLAPERVLGGPAGPAIGLLDVPGHRIPGTGRPHPRAPLVRVQDQAVVAGAHEVALVGGEVEADD